MERIYIPQLAKSPDQTDVISANGYVSDLETLTPVQGRLVVSHRGNYLEVTTQVETIMTLTCDRCLQRYNHRVELDVSELIWLERSVPEDDSSGAENEVPVEDLVETLDPDGYFDPANWLYEQLCLEIPPRCLCDPDCPGISLEAKDEFADETNVVDHRWASLELFKQQLPH